MTPIVKSGENSTEVAILSRDGEIRGGGSVVQRNFHCSRNNVNGLNVIGYAKDTARLLTGFFAVFVSRVW